MLGGSAMRILIDHVTRMQPGFICVAGLDSADAHVRPVVVGARLPALLLARHGGPFEMGALVDLGPTAPVGQPPETEDARFEPWRTQRLRYVAPEELWAAVRRCARPTFGAIFGPALRPRRRTCATAVGEGSASLGCLACAALPERPRLF